MTGERKLFIEHIKVFRDSLFELRLDKPLITYLITYFNERLGFSQHCLITQSCHSFHMVTYNPLNPKCLNLIPPLPHILSGSTSFAHFHKLASLKEVGLVYRFTRVYKFLYQNNWNTLSGTCLEISTYTFRTCCV